MLSSTFWTEPRFTGVVLIVGALLIGSGAGLYTPIKDEKGSFIFGQPPREWLRLVFAHPRLWRWGTALFISGVVVTVLGLAMFSGLLRDAGDRTFSLLGLVAFAFGSGLWVICLAFRLSIDPWAAQETAKTGAIPEFYVPLTRLPRRPVCDLHRACLLSACRLWRSGALHQCAASMGGLACYRLRPG